MHKIQNKRKMLIVGGSGFLGYHLAKSALKNGWYIDSISRKLPKKNRKLPRVKYLVCDISKYKNINSIDILKIDTQGYEKNVLLGCKRTLKKIKVICLEINLWDYYEKSVTFFDIEKIIKNNFQLWDISFIYKNPKWHCTDYMDVVYINKKFLKTIL